MWVCVLVCVCGGGVVGWVGVIDLFEGHRDGSYIKQMKIPGVCVCERERVCGYVFGCGFVCE